MKKIDEDEPGGASPYWNPTSKISIPIMVQAKATKNGIQIAFEKKISSKINKSHETRFPKEIWSNYPSSEKEKLKRNILFNFTAHIPLLIEREVHFKANIQQPEIYSWIYHSLMRFLPAYSYLYNDKNSKAIIPVLKTILNSNWTFEEPKDEKSEFSQTDENKVVIPLTFGKDSLLSYYLAKSLNLKTTLVYFNEPTEKYAKQHKLLLIKQFLRENQEKYHFIDNDIASLRAPDNGWFGWESTLTSYALLSLPFAHTSKAKYIIFSNEISCNDSFRSKDNIDVMFDYEQSHHATAELSTITKNLTNGNVNCTNLLEGLYEIAITGILKQQYPQSLKYLMSCWAENSKAKECRWCEHCSKCARIYIFLTANGIEPKDVGFKNSMLTEKKENLFSIFETKSQTKSITYDSLGINREEQLLAFYLTALRENQSPLIKKFKKSALFPEIKKRAKSLLKKYYSLHPENMSPKKLRPHLNKILSSALKKSLTELNSLPWNN